MFFGKKKFLFLLFLFTLLQAENYPKESYLEQSDVNKLARGDGTYQKD